MKQSKSLRDFYYQIQNIGKKNHIEPKLKEIIKENQQKLEGYTISVEGLCKVLSEYIALDLGRNQISYKKINTKEMGAAYEHEALLAHEKIDEQIYYYLVDPSFKQFQKVEGQSVNPKFKDFPNKILCQTAIGSKLSSALLTEGYNEVDDYSWEEYLKSFSAPFLPLEDFVFGKEKFKNK